MSLPKIVKDISEISTPNGITISTIKSDFTITW